MLTILPGLLLLASFCGWALAALALAALVQVQCARRLPALCLSTAAASSAPPKRSPTLLLPPACAPLQASQSERCRVRVTISDRRGAHASGEHKVVLAAVVVATEGTAMHPWA